MTVSQAIGACPALRLCEADPVHYDERFSRLLAPLGEAVVVPPGREVAFLADQPVALLPLEPELHRRLRLLGLRTLGQLAALPEAAVTAQFGRAGTRAWRLATGRAVEPVVGRPIPEPVTATVAFFAPVAEH